MRRPIFPGPAPWPLAALPAVAPRSPPARAGGRVRVRDWGRAPRRGPSAREFGRSGAGGAFGGRALRPGEAARARAAAWHPRGGPGASGRGAASRGFDPALGSAGAPGLLPPPSPGPAAGVSDRVRGRGGGKVAALLFGRLESPGGLHGVSSWKLRS